MLFSRVVAAYCALCIVIASFIVIHGDGPRPRVTAIYPASGDRYWPGGIAQISFSQEMDHASVERGLQVSPGGQGLGSWYGNTLNLQPVGGWKPGVTYRLSFVGSVTDTLGRPLHTPFAYWFRVHRITRVRRCLVNGVPNVCEAGASPERDLTHSRVPVLQYAVSDDGSLLAFTRRDRSGLPHLFVIAVDSSRATQLSSGTAYADSSPFWSPGDNTDVSYYRRPARRLNGHIRLGKPQLWNVQTNGAENARM